jgi:hypothetical protein
VAEARAWFRLYSEFAFDPKVQLLDETLQRRFLMLLCLAGAGITPTSNVSEVDFALRVGVSECEKTRSILVSKGLIDEQWFPVKWKKRQFESDTSTPRVKRFRQRHKVVTSTVTETPSEQNRTEQNRAHRRSGVSRGAKRVPKEFKPDLSFAVTLLPDIDAEAEAQKFRDWEFKKPRSDWDATWRTWIRTCKDKGQYSRKEQQGWM